MTPNTAMPSMIRLVAIGRRMKTLETFTGLDRLVASIAPQVRTELRSKD